MTEHWRILPISQGLPIEEVMKRHRLNCFGSLYYFIKVALRKTKLTPRLHLPFCRSLEVSRLKDVIEMPRDHYKSTIASEGLPMWWALPLTAVDEQEMIKLGYSNDYIRFMRRVHNPNTRTLLTSENLTNASKLGSRIRWHFESNAMYRNLFPETLPTGKEIWTSVSMHVNRPGLGGAQGEGTFDFLGVGGALQSRHYDRSIQDDLVGRKAIESVTIMDKTIDYHRLLIGAFESDDSVKENDELIIGNRWGYDDLNSYVRENEPWFRIQTHGALGGCCKQHPRGIPIFPEEFTKEKLEKIKKRLGPYLFSCQFLNDPSSPEDADFKMEWLKYFDTYKNENKFDTIRHEVYDGHVTKDLSINFISKAMAVDPNHAGNAAKNRCRHAIVVVGLSDVGDYYLLDYWAEAAPYDTLFDRIYSMAEKWQIRQVGFETVAAQKYAAYHITQRNRAEKWPIQILPLKGEVDTPDGGVSRSKDWRIRNVLEPIFARGNFWCRRNAESFKTEYKTFPRGQYVDILDALAYIPQLLKGHIPYERHMAMLSANKASARRMGSWYSVH